MITGQNQSAPARVFLFLEHVAKIGLTPDCERVPVLLSVVLQVWGGHAFDKAATGAKLVLENGICLAESPSEEVRLFNIWVVVLGRLLRGTRVHHKCSLHGHAQITRRRHCYLAVPTQVRTQGILWLHHEGGSARSLGTRDWRVFSHEVVVLLSCGLGEVKITVSP